MSSSFINKLYFSRQPRKYQLLPIVLLNIKSEDGIENILEEKKK